MCNDDPETAAGGWSQRGLRTVLVGYAGLIFCLVTTRFDSLLWATADSVWGAVARKTANTCSCHSACRDICCGCSLHELLRSLLALVVPDSFFLLLFLSSFAYRLPHSRTPRGNELFPKKLGVGGLWQFCKRQFLAMRPLVLRHCVNSILYNYGSP